MTIHKNPRPTKHALEKKMNIVVNKVGDIREPDPANLQKSQIRPCRLMFDKTSEGIPRERTYIVLGSGRGGTSMVAGALERLGVPMIGGQSDFAANMEDQEISDAICGYTISPDPNRHANLGEPPSASSQDRLKSLACVIERRNLHHKVWGFKDPSSYLYLDSIRSSFVNPHFIAIYRDFAAIAEREYVSNNYPIDDGLRAAFDRYARINEIVLSWRIPTLIVSYERATIQKMDFVRLLAHFVGLRTKLEANPDILYFLSPEGGYKESGLSKRGSWLNPGETISSTPSSLPLDVHTPADDAILEVKLDRKDVLVRGLNHSTMTGVEIGPFFSPVVPKSGAWNTIVVDFTDTAGLRDIARNHTSQDIREREHLIEQVDIVWCGQPLDDACLAINPQGYDFLIASHVVEHIPDFVRFFQIAGRLLKSNGIISLALPDMRYCFDFFRPLSMTNHVVDAYFDKRSRHSPSTLFQAVAYQAWVNGEGAWLRGRTSQMQLVGSLRQAFDMYRRELEKGTDPATPYIDAHAWSFTPSSFALIILELNALGLIDFQITHLEDGEGSEFFVQMTRGHLEVSEAGLQELRQTLITQTVKEQAARYSQCAEI